MRKSGWTLSDETKAKMSAASKGKSKSPAHIAAIGAAKAAARLVRTPAQQAAFDAARRAKFAATIAARNAARDRKRKNDAAFLEIARQLFAVISEEQQFLDDGTPVKGIRYRGVESIEKLKQFAARKNPLIDLGLRWLDGEDVLLAKLAQP